MKLLVMPHNEWIETVAGTRLYEVLEDANIFFDNCCNGIGTCGRCKVILTKGNNKRYTKRELEVLTTEERNRGVRLACHVVIEEDMALILPNRFSKVNEQINSLGIMKQEIVKGKEDKAPIAKIKVGTVIDIGTTNMVASLWDLKSNIKLLEKSFGNPQRIYGLDVIKRVSYGIKSKEHENRLHQILLRSIDILIGELHKEANVCRNGLQEVILVGNTTIIYTLRHRPLKELLQIPFISVNYSGEILGHNEFYMELDGIVEYSLDTKFKILPLIQGHVGSDALAGILSTKLHNKEGKYLLIDIGTNGELVLSDNKTITVCSTAAGPAFEGGNISCGMVAKEGAITKVSILGEEIVVHNIGEEEGITPIGICGSGIVDIISNLLRKQWMDNTGRLQGVYADDNKVILYEDNKTQVALTQKDIREFQLAKAAIKAGTLLLLESRNMHMEDIDEVYIAGALGSNMGVENMICTGIIPWVEKEKVSFIGNSALDGGSKVLLQEYTWEDINEIASSCDYIELATNKNFQEIFIESIYFSVNK